MKNKQKPFGFKGSILPVSAIKDLSESWEQDGILFFIKEGFFEVSYSTKKDHKKALEIANLFVQSWNFQHSTELEVRFNQFWESKKSRKTFQSITLDEKIKVSDRVSTVNKIIYSLSYHVKANILGKSDSSSFVVHKNLVEKCLNDDSLKKSIGFYSNEVIGKKRPLYGIYKSLEILIEKLKGRGSKRDGMTALAELAGKNYRYVDEVMERTQLQRHAVSRARNVLSETECRHRAKGLIQAYADSI